MRILITGATDGIGLALAHIYHAEGHELILHGRRGLGHIGDPLFTPETYCQADLTQSDYVYRFEDFFEARNITSIDLLIHNAGIGFFGATELQPPDNIQQVLYVNLLAPLVMTHRFLPLVRAAKGKIVFISTVATAMPNPSYAVYGASKSALDGLVRSLQTEIGDEVPIQLIQPGATHTGMHEKAGLTRDQMDWTTFTPAEDVARQIAASIRTKRRRVVVGFQNQILRRVAHYFAYPVEEALRQKRDDKK